MAPDEKTEQFRYFISDCNDSDCLHNHKGCCSKFSGIEINNISDSINQKFKVQENSKYVYSVSLTSNIIINNSPNNDTLMIKPNINNKDFDINKKK